MRGFKTNIKWIIVFLLFIVICSVIIILQRNLSKDVKTAQISQNGKIIRTVDLENEKEVYEFEITASNGGTNTVRVENGKIGIISASCPDKICVNQGFTDSGTLPVICLPNKLSIVIVDDNDDLDAVTGTLNVENLQ
jgi:hypothetical protein